MTPEFHTHIRTARTGACVLALATLAMFVTPAAVPRHGLAGDSSGDDMSGAAGGGEFGDDDVAPYASVATQLAHGIHPAAEPAFGSLWAVSRQLVIPVAGLEPGDLKDTFNEKRGPTRRHKGIDIPAARGTPVLAATDGVITRLTVHDSGGISLYHLAPDRQTLFYYAHLSRYAEGVREGRFVRRGDVIGYVGDTGNAGRGNYHLHFEVMTARNPRHNGGARPHNPYPLLVRGRG